MIRRSLTAAAFTATLATAAFAQGALVEVSDNAMLMPWNISADAAEDLDVIGLNGQRIGEVEEVVGADASTPSALVVDFDDDAGFGDRDDVVVPAGEFTYAGNRLTLDADAAAIAAMPVWDD